jgi:hypothetical protein
MRNLLFGLCILLVFSCSLKEKETTLTTEDTLIPASSSTASSIDETSEAVVNEFIIYPGKAGLVEKGMYAGKLYQFYDSTLIHKTLKENHATYSIYESNGQTPSLACIVTSSDTIVTIHIYNSAYKTEKGIGVGNTMGELMKAYHVAEVYTDNDSKIMVKVEELQQKLHTQNNSQTESVEFEIGFDATSLVNENGDIDAGSIPPEVKIISIVL